MLATVPPEMVELATRKAAIPGSAGSLFKEEEHPRGQPENAGEFVKKSEDDKTSGMPSEPKKWPSKIADLEKWYGHYDAWAKDLSEDERQAIDAYKDDSEFINESLRWSKNRKKYQKTVQELTSAIEKSEVPHNLVVYRGAKATFYAHAKVGGIITDLGFVSTSLSQQIMREFGDEGEGDARIRIAILVPKGSKAAYVTQVNDEDHTEEVLLQRGSRFKVLKREGGKIIMKLLPRRAMR